MTELQMLRQLEVLFDRAISQRPLTEEQKSALDTRFQEVLRHLRASVVTHDNLQKLTAQLTDIRWRNIK